MADLVLPRVGLGGGELGNLHEPRSDDDAHAILQAAWDGGVRYFDTAPHYGLGLAERRLGRFLADKPRAAYVVALGHRRSAPVSDRWIPDRAAFHRAAL